jgi:hypothetical protein
MRTTKRSALQQESKTNPVPTITYEVVGIKIGIVGFKDELIDLSNITNQDAERLIKKGFPYLKQVPTLNEVITG